MSDPNYFQSIEQLYKKFQNIKRTMILYFNFLPCFLRNKTHIDMKLGFNPFLEDLTPLTSQNDLLANNCQKKLIFFYKLIQKQRPIPRFFISCHFLPMFFTIAA
jgi:hypothetical protein